MAVHTALDIKTLIQASEDAQGNSARLKIEARDAIERARMIVEEVRRDATVRARGRPRRA